MNSASSRGQTRRNSGAAAVKREGATYTPPALATFVASHLVGAAKLPSEGVIRVLDPAIGDGALVHALLDALPEEARVRCIVSGFETDDFAIRVAGAELRTAFPGVEFRLQCEDFLRVEHAETYDLAIANPPYVRTQVMGAEQAQDLADRYGLTGRVDLYYAFLVAIGRVLAQTGTAGLITSNRFLTTRSGKVVRRALQEMFRVQHVWDLGDTKLFGAAVLPAVMVVNGRGRERPSGTLFTSIYQTNAEPQANADDALRALEAEDNDVVGLPDGRSFQVKHGLLANGGDPEGVWRLATIAGDDWLMKVADKTWGTFRTVGKVRVGVKTTADSVFSRSDWASLPGGEPELLRPLITRHCAQRFRAQVPKDVSKRKKILYPHTVVSGRRVAVKIMDYPKAREYLETHRGSLSSRTYLSEAGRNWFEIWVPQDPSAWGEPKVVFLDIAEKPTFWMDLDGAVVNGECYFMRAEGGMDPNLLWLVLAVANSSFIEAFYDRKFNNKLYAGRRRFITQYVEQFPIPDPSHQEVQDIIAASKRVYEITPGEEAKRLAAELDTKIWHAFGLLPEEATG